MTPPVERVRKLLAAGDLDGAEVLCNETLAQHPRTRPILVLRAQIAEHRGDWPSAAERWQHVLAAEPDNEESWPLLRCAAALIKLERYDEVETLLVPAQARWPDQIGVFHLLSRALERRRRLRPR